MERLNELKRRKSGSSEEARNDGDDG